MRDILPRSMNLRGWRRSKATLLIEDACHALGAEYHGKRVGSIADMTVFSFHPVKHLTTGEGGMVATNDARLAETLRRFRNHGISSEARERQEAGQWFYEMVLLGFNYRLTDIACALGLSQLEKLDANLARRREIAARYAEGLRDLPIVLPAVREGVEPAWHLYPIRLQLEMLTADRAEIFRALRAENIGVNVHYIPVHRHPYYRERFNSAETYAVAEDAYDRLISLPMFHSMVAQDVEDVIHALHKVLAHFEMSRETKYEGEAGRSHWLGSRQSK
jgi:perosamine synthetase